jgi:oligopeptide transport system ATP-binding protein
MTELETANTTPGMQDDILVDVRNLKVNFPVKSGGIIPRRVGEIKAVDDVTLFVRRGETLGLVGESGCGKTTLGRAILQLERPTSGDIYFDGENLAHMNRSQLRSLRRKAQIIFQDPYTSLDPRQTAGDCVGEPLKVHKLVQGRGEYRDEVDRLLETVGLSPNMAKRFPHEFSGGQRQRIGIARALAVKPDFIVCDEPVSALDVSIQGQIINLLQQLQEDFNLTYLFVSHDLSVVRHVSDRIAVMYLGRIVEVAGRDELYEDPLHPYTRALLSAIPIPDPDIEEIRERITLTGEVPSPLNPPVGCSFHPRCSMAIDQCSSVVPDLQEIKNNHSVACIRSQGYKTG